MKWIAAVAFSVLLAAPVLAAADQEKPATPETSKPSATAGKSGNLSGAVSAVTNSSLTVKATSGEETFTIDEKTKVIGSKMGRQAEAMKKAGEKVVITEFVGTGDTVRVTYRDENGTKKASEVRVTQKKM
jgi:hypothetical protein